MHINRLWLGGALAAVLGIGALSLSAAPKKAQAPRATPKTSVVVPQGKQVATFAAGCFWSMEAIFKQLKGVEKVVPGYAGGQIAKPSYEQVETGTTGHAEALQITFDPKVITYRDLLTVLLTVRNPTTPNQQGPDIGPQYRSVIFTHNAGQTQDAQAVIKQISAQRVWKAPIVTPVLPFANFYNAEDYHFNYYNLHPDQPYCRGVILPEIQEFRAKFKSKLKK